MSKKKSGRKPLWEELDIPSKLEAIKGWAQQGSTDAEIMEMLNVSKNVFYQWKKEKKEFYDALKKGRYDSNGEILNSAFKQTTGYYQTITEPMKLKKQVNKGTEEKPFWVEEDVIEMVTYDKFVPANNTMTIFMLKNRIPEHYKDKQERELTGELGVTLIDDVTDDD